MELVDLVSQVEEEGTVSAMATSRFQADSAKQSARSDKMEQAPLHRPSAMVSDSASHTRARDDAHHGVVDHRSSSALSHNSAPAHTGPDRDYDSDFQIVDENSQPEEVPDCGEEEEEALPVLSTPTLRNSRLS